MSLGYATQADVDYWTTRALQAEEVATILRAENERLRRAMDTIRMNCAAPSDWPDQRWVRDTIIATIDANKTEGK